MGHYPHFILPMRRSRGFASTATDFVALFRLAFASAPRQCRLTLPMTVSRRIIMQKARRQAFPLRGIALRPLVGMWFQVHYPPLVGVLPIVRSRYWFAIGRQGVLSLAGWTPPLQTAFHVHGPTQVPDEPLSPAAYGAFTRYGRPFQIVPLEYSRPLCPVLQPHSDESKWFRLFRVRSPLLTESLLLSFPGGTEMFQFPPFAPHTYGFSVRSFGNPGINARLTTPPGLSQPATPFIASWRQDIPHMPLVAWPH